MRLDRFLESKSARKNKNKLWKASKRGELKAIQLILQNEPKEIEAINQYHPIKGTTALMIACSNKHSDVVRFLIEMGADLNMADRGQHQNTALHYAAYQNNVTAIEYLLHAGCNPYLWNRRGHTAIDLAILRHRRSAVSALMQHLVVKKGWLYCRKSNAGLRSLVWKRRWIVVLACNPQKTALQLCIYKSDDVIRPNFVVLLNMRASLHVTLREKTAFLDKSNMFAINTPMDCQRMRRKSFTRNPAIINKSRIKKNKLQFAAETEEGRHSWMNLFNGSDQPQTDHFFGTSVQSYSHSSIAAISTIPSSSAPLVLSMPTGLVSLSNSQGMLFPFSNVVAEPSAPPMQMTEFEAGMYPLVEDTISGIENYMRGGGSVATALASPPSSINNTSNARSECVICMDAPKDAICIPCGHIAGCFTCLQALHTCPSGQCPICRVSMTNVIKIYEC
jgi:hypothetical protein